MFDHQMPIGREAGSVAVLLQAPRRADQPPPQRHSALAVQLFKDDPSLVKEVIARLRKSGDIEPDDLVYLDEIADRWIKIAEGNRQKARR